MAERHELTGPLFDQAKRAIALLNAEAYTAFDKSNDKPNQIKYPVRALQEAVINAIVHRDYEINAPNRITVFSDRVEIHSQGALHWAVDQAKFKEGKASPHWRNQSFGHFFLKMSVAQTEGQGIPTIIRTMREEGCPPPVFDLGKETVTCILPAHPRHQMIAVLQQVQSDVILRDYDKAQAQLLMLLEEDPYNFRAIDLLVDIAVKQETPKIIYDFMVEKALDFNRINQDTLEHISRGLGIQAVQNLPNEEQVKIALMSMGVIGARLKGNHVLRQIAETMLTLDQQEEPQRIVTLVDHSIANHPELIDNAFLLGKRANAKMDLAKKCLQTI